MFKASVIREGENRFKIELSLQAEGLKLLGQKTNLNSHWSDVKCEFIYKMQSDVVGISNRSGPAGAITPRDRPRDRRVCKRIKVLKGTDRSYPPRRSKFTVHPQNTRPALPHANKE
jgi:hypothetical protein